MKCIICDKKHSKNILFENEDIIVMLAIEPAVNGHIQIFPKEHRTIFEHLEDKLLAKIIDAANKISMILFEVLKIHGTNIIINNGVSAGQKIPHFSIDVIPRRNDDGLKLDWDLKQASEDNLSSIHRIINEEIISMPKESVNKEKLKDSKENNENKIVQEQVIIQKPISKNPVIDVEAKEIKKSEDNSENTSENSDMQENKSEEKPKEKKYNYYHKYFERTP
jgi:diadenosine tetraphosphate (Ap4A) HIT family hydrolase